jgi:hypothetical protein
MAVTLNANTSTGFIATSDTSGVLQLQTGGTAAVTVDASANVGIGTASPSRKLVVSNAGAAGFEFGAGVGAGSGNEVLNYNRSTSLYIPSFAYASTHTFYAGTAGGTRALDIDSSGNVGIGTSSPTYKVEARSDTPAFFGAVNGDGTRYGYTTALPSNSGNCYVGWIPDSVGSSGVNGDLALQPRTSAGANIRFFTGSTSATERARITSGGDILLGKTAADTTGAGIYVETSSINYGRINFIKAAASGTGATSALAFYYNGTQVGTVTSSSTATAYNTSSDYRLKNSIAPMTSALDKVTQLKPCTYKWNVDGSEGQGFIAHELAEIVPQCVHGEKDAVETYTDEDGNEQTRPVYQGIDTSFLVATLTAAIQEQQAIIQTLTDRITALEGTTP